MALTFSIHTNTDTFANSADPDETALKNLHFLPLLLPRDGNFYLQQRIQKWKRTCQKFGGKSVFSDDWSVSITGNAVRNNCSDKRTASQRRKWNTEKFS